MASPGRPREAAPQNTRTSIPGLFGEWIRQGAEGFIATQKILLDLAAQQNALALTIVRERLGFFLPASPTKSLINLAHHAVANLIETQQIILDVVARQNSIVADGLKPGYEGTPIEGLAEVAHQGIDTLIKAQKKFLEIVETETEGALKDLEEGKGVDSGRLTELARDSMHNFIDAQRKFLDVVEDELVTKKESQPKAEEAEKKRVDIFEMAKQSVDAFVEAEKRLLDVASDQVGVNVKFVRDIFTSQGPEKPTTSLPDIVKKSVDSFVAAQKALVDIASKPRAPLHEKETAEPEIVIAKG